MRSSRWGRHPGGCTCAARDGRPGWLSRTQTPPGGRSELFSANQAAAFARISFSSRRIRFSRRSRRSSSRSAVVSPSRRPSSTSAWFTQLRIVWSDGSNSRLSSPGVRPALTRRTISARNSAGYGALVFGILLNTPIWEQSQVLECPRKRVNLKHPSELRGTLGGDLMDQCSMARHPHERYKRPSPTGPGHALTLGISVPGAWSTHRTGSSTTTPSQTNRKKWWTPIRSLRLVHRECSVRRSARFRGWNCRQPTKGEHMAEQVRADGVGVVGGVDTHRDFHVGAVVDGAGRLLGSDQFGADTSGYAQLVAPMESWGRICRVGVGGTGSYGAGLTRHLAEAGIGVVEVNRPNRQLRRRRGKDDTTDAEAAARAALSGEATALPKTGDGPVEATRMLRVVRRSGVKARTQAANQIHALVVTAPEQVKHQLRDLPTRTQVKVCARFRPGTPNPHRNNPLPETPHRTRDIPPPHRPAPNTPRNRPTPPPNPSPNHPHPRRPPPRHAAHRPITTRTRPPPQPPARYPISAMAHRHHEKPDL